MNRAVAVIDAPSRNGLKQPYRDLLPPLSNDEKSALKASIELEGVRDAIVIDEDGNILDGHHRYAMDHNAPRRVINGLSEAEKKAYVYRANFARRNLSPDQKRDKLAAMKVIAVELNKAEWSQPKIGAALGVARETVRDWLATNGGNANGCETSHNDSRVVVPKTAYPAIFEVWQKGTSREQIAANYGVKRQTIDKIINSEKNRREKEDMREAAKHRAQNTGDRYVIKHAPCIDALNLPAQSIDWIVTDPPYAKEFLSVYDDLARVAAHVLRSGGSALVMTGQSYLPQVILSLSNHLTYHWTLAYLTPGGQSAQIFPRKVNPFWKPILWFTNDNYEGEWIGDVIKSDANDNDKNHHKWGQSESGMFDLMRRFIKANQTVLDPFCGAGTTGVIAIGLSAYFLGFDSDAKAVATSAARITEAINGSVVFE